MAAQIAFIPTFVILAIIFVVITYWKTKSFVKIGYAFEILFGLFAMIIASSQLVDINLIISIDFLALGLIINGVISLVK